MHNDLRVFAEFFVGSCCVILTCYNVSLHMFVLCLICIDKPSYYALYQAGASYSTFYMVRAFDTARGV